MRIKYGRVCYIYCTSSCTLNLKSLVSEMFSVNTKPVNVSDDTSCTYIYILLNKSIYTKVTFIYLHVFYNLLFERPSEQVGR